MIFGSVGDIMWCIRSKASVNLFLGFCYKNPTLGILRNIPNEKYSKDVAIRIFFVYVDLHDQTTLIVFFLFLIFTFALFIYNLFNRKNYPCDFGCEVGSSSSRLEFSTSLTTGNYTIL